MCPAFSRDKRETGEKATKFFGKISMNNPIFYLFFHSITIRKKILEGLQTYFNHR